MSCQRFQIDLSRCLDGRLPSARRAEVMTHVDQCPNCEQVWADMQAAQSLVFGLDQPRVGSNFRNQL
jgi:anti-sigma factor RsiW